MCDYTSIGDFDAEPRLLQLLNDNGFHGGNSDFAIEVRRATIFRSKKPSRRGLPTPLAILGSLRATTTTTQNGNDPQALYPSKSMASSKSSGMKCE